MNYRLRNETYHNHGLFTSTLVDTEIPQSKTAYRSQDVSKAISLSSQRFSIVAMDAFYALAEPRRRKVVEVLVQSGPLSATRICDEFDVTPQAISQHLRVLREANVIQMEKRAQQRLYSFNPQSMNQIEMWASDMVKLWNSRLDRLDRALKEIDVQSQGVV